MVLAVSILQSLVCHRLYYHNVILPLKVILALMAKGKCGYLKCFSQCLVRNPYKLHLGIVENPVESLVLICTGKYSSYLLKLSDALAQKDHI